MGKDAGVYKVLPCRGHQISLLETNTWGSEIECPYT